MPRTSPLAGEHRATGARLVEVDGWEVAADYGDVPAEYRALREGAALFDLSLRGKIGITGTDRAAFLHNMVTNDVRSLRPGQGCNAALLSLQGKMEAGMRIHCLEDAIWCDIDPGPAERVRAVLAKHLILEDAKQEDMTESWALLAVQGPGSDDVLARSGSASARPAEGLAHTWTEIEGTRILLVRLDHSGEGGFDLWVPAAEGVAVWRALRDRGGARPAGLAALDARRIEAGIPWAGSEIDGEHFPMEAGLDAGWISYTKGCYLGQETISRLHHLGHVNRHLVSLTLPGDSVPTKGATLWAGEKRAGAITSAALSPRDGRAVALAYVHRDHAVPGTELEFEDGAARTPIAVASLPRA
jgi:folate-binding protein YgfZ